jgi:hypothetical protein
MGETRILEDVSEEASVTSVGQDNLADNVAAVASLGQDNLSDNMLVEDQVHVFYALDGVYGAFRIYTKYVVNNAGFVYRIMDDYDNNNKFAKTFEESSFGDSNSEDYQREIDENLRDIGVKFPGDPDERWLLV